LNFGIIGLLKGGDVKTDILLTGLVSGLTIILGVITADWLKRLRDRINYTRRITTELAYSLKKFIEYLGSHLMARTDVGIGIQRSEGEIDLIETFNLLAIELRDLSEMPRWPQRNAARIRQAASSLRICLFANIEHCSIYQVLLHAESADELLRMEFVLRSATRSRRAFESTMHHLSEKKEELKEQMLSRAVANT
jgi:hypothetical protein